ncbi:MAG: Gfo/Idh/MocA family protein [Planctomycetota bacterium]|jgi:predicted dehydrogenase
MTRVAVIGTTGHLGYATQGIKEVDGAEFVGAAPGNGAEALSEFWRTEFAHLPTYESYLDLLETEKPEVAVVTPHFHLHAEITAACLERGIHVFCEKPLALSQAALGRVQEAVRKGGARLGLMLDYRYNPAFYAAFQAIQDGRIGEVVHIFTQKSYKSGSKPEWQHKRELFGGTISWVGSHALDWLLWVSEGKPIVRSVAKDTKIHNKGNGEMESSAYCCFDFEGGGQAMASIDYLRPSTAPCHGDDRLRVAGSTGVVEVLFGKTTLISEEEGVLELPLKEQPQIFADFLGAIAEDRPFRHSHEDAWRLTELCIAAQEAADTGAAIQQKI